MSTLFSIITFAIATAFTPGPNNLMLLSSGLTFGYKRTLPHIFGVAFGKALKSLKKHGMGFTHG